MNGLYWYTLMLPMSSKPQYDFRSSFHETVSLSVFCSKLLSTDTYCTRGACGNHEVSSSSNSTIRKKIVRQFWLFPLWLDTRQIDQNCPVPSLELSAAFQEYWLSKRPLTLRKRLTGCFEQGYSVTEMLTDAFPTSLKPCLCLARIKILRRQFPIKATRRIGQFVQRLQNSTLKDLGCRSKKLPRHFKPLARAAASTFGYQVWK